MNRPLYFRASDDDASAAGASWAGSPVRGDRTAVVGTALWVYLGVATSLFFLFIVSYLIRMQGPDWHAIALPWQVRLSTALLLAASAAIQVAASASQRENAPAWRCAMQVAGACLFAFLLAQSWAWGALLGSGVGAVGNPAASYFYVLSAAHALHVAGGVGAWYLVVRSGRHARAGCMPARSVGATRLCARYWHFLLLAWLAILATLAGVTRDVIGFICGTS